MNFEIKVICFLTVSISIGFAFRLESKPKIPGNSCVDCHVIDPEKINVHLVHHSHDDVGWLKTMDQYFWGLNSSYANAGVQYIISSVVNALWDHPDRRFIQVETAFFWMWWKSQNDVMRNKFKSLVDRGQLEIINGGWVMNDEACVNYQSTIDQFTWGFRILNETLGECGKPTIGWQIDPFGHSREHASIVSKMGFEGLFFARLDNNDRELRKIESNMDFLWKTSANNEDSVIFGGMFGSDNIYYPPSGFCFDVLCSDESVNDDPESDDYNAEKRDSVIFGGMFGSDHVYYPPNGFCFDVLCTDESINDDPESDDYNADKRVNEFAEYIKSYASYFKTKNMLITMGGDFQYQAAEKNFANSDKLIRAFQNHSSINLIYSTPSCYMKAVYDAKPNLVTKTDDFFPYGSADHSYWAGYFTSRQNFKRFERVSHNILQVAKQLSAIASANQIGVNIDLIKGLREAIGVVQHHDSITGTEKQHVAKDYTRILSKAVSKAQLEFTDIIGNLVLGTNISSSTQLTSCLLANMSICTVSQTSDQFIVVAYNPLSWPVNHVVRLPVEDESFVITGLNGQVDFDVVTPISNFSYVRLENVNVAKRELVFVASKIPPLGLQAYYVTKSSNKSINENKQSLDNIWKFGDDDIGFTINNTTNLLESVTMNGETVQIRQEFMYYESNNGTDTEDASGAYIFRPNGEALPFDNPIITYKTQGTVVDEIHQKVNDWITQIIRVYKGTHNYIEFDWLVGPLDTPNNTGKEIITRFTADNYRSDLTFYTDSNGRETIERKLNYRPTYSYNSSYEPIASNYYPVTSEINIVDLTRDLKIAVLNDRSQGGSSLAEGQIELMVHRRTFKDDRKGVGEPLNEYEFEQGIVARGQHYLIVGPVSQVLRDGKTISAQERIVAQQKLLQAWIGVGDASKLSDEEIIRLVNTSYSALKSKLPENINILTLEPWTPTSYLLRLEHLMEKVDDPNLSGAVIVDLQDLFAGFTLSNIVETTLGANRNLDSFKKNYDWSYNTGYAAPTDKHTLKAHEVVLSAMDIKTFIVEINPN